MTDLVIIKWIDSSTAYAWQTPDEVKDIIPLIVTTVGYIQNETDEFITIASHIAEYTVTGIMCIPKVCIKSTEVLQSPDVKKGSYNG